MKNTIFTIAIVSLVFSSLLNWAFATGKISLAQQDTLESLYAQANTQHKGK
jgi:hypothetical protein